MNGKKDTAHQLRKRLIKVEVKEFSKKPIDEKLDIIFAQLRFIILSKPNN